VPPDPRESLLHKAIDWFAVSGVGDTSLRGVAAGIGTSHRMLIHHFGSRDGLLTAVVAAVEADQRRLLAELSDVEDPETAGWEFWRSVCDAALVYGPLLYELSAHAMQHRPHAESLRASLIGDWIGPLALLWERTGVAPAEAQERARLDLAVARGLLQDLLLTGDRTAVDRAMRRHLDNSIIR